RTGAPARWRIRWFHADGAAAEATRRRAPRRALRRDRGARVAATRLAREGPQRATGASHGRAQRLPDRRTPSRGPVARGTVTPKRTHTAAILLTAFLRLVYGPRQTRKAA